MSPEAKPPIVSLRCLCCGAIIERAEILSSDGNGPLYRKVEPPSNEKIVQISPVCPARGKGLPHVTARTQGRGK